METEGIDDEDVATSAQEIRGGTPTGIGEYDAVGFLLRDGDGDGIYGARCTATLISKSAILTAAHCLCGADVPYPCNVTGIDWRVKFTNVLPVGGGLRADSLWNLNTYYVHPNYVAGGSHYSDYMVWRLDFASSMSPPDSIMEVDDTQQIAPMPVSDEPMTTGELATLVGYGRYGEAPNECGLNDGVNNLKRETTTDVDQINFVGNGWQYQFDDGLRGSCPGDSGGPAIDSSGRLSAVSSTYGPTGGDITFSRYDAVFDIYDWLGTVACPYFDRGDPDAGFSTDLCKGVTPEGDCDFDNQCATGHVCAKDIGKLVGFPSTWDLCWASDQFVSLYQNNNYTGNTQSFPPGTWAGTELSVIGNDATSSLRVAPGLTVQLCASASGGAPCQTYTGDTPGITGAIMDQVSYVRVSPGVTLYSGTASTGNRQTFVEGSYSAAQMNVVGDNAASSLVVTPGVIVTLCQEPLGTPGYCRRYWNRMTLGSDMNNLASSVTVELGAVVYSGQDYTGAHEGFPIGTHASSGWQYIPNDSISSLVVAPGRIATLCTHGSGVGPCKTFTEGWYPWVGFGMDDTVSWIQVSDPP